MIRSKKFLDNAQQVRNVSTQAEYTDWQRCETFMAEFYAATIQNPFAHFERVWEMKAVFEISPFANSINLGAIRALERRKGWGSQALDWLLALAAKHGVTIVGNVCPVGMTRPRLTKRELKAWYKRHGFIVKGDVITWQPKKQSNSQAAASSK